jgi:hypothetical protein
VDDGPIRQAGGRGDVPDHLVHGVSEAATSPLMATRCHRPRLAFCSWTDIMSHASAKKYADPSHPHVQVTIHGPTIGAELVAQRKELRPHAGKSTGRGRIEENVSHAENHSAIA